MPVQIDKHKVWRWCSATFAAAALTLAKTDISLAQSGSAVQSQGTQTSAQVIDAAVHEIELTANDVANARAYFDDDLRPIRVRVSYSSEDGHLYFDFDERLGNEAGYTNMVDLLTEIESKAHDLIDLLIPGEEPEYRYGGHDTGWWLDKAVGIEPASETHRVRRGVQERVMDGPLVIAGGHGYYYNSAQKRWTSQRDVVNGVLEDDLTQVLSDHLRSRLLARYYPSENLRRMRGRFSHAKSGLDWWRLGVRYHLESVKPNLPSLWNSQPDDTSADHERKQDLRSRPLYANHVKAPALINVHTNADSKSASGARVYVYPGRSEDSKLATLILCAMTEQLRSVDEFTGYPVASKPHISKKHAETRLSKGPSVIVEVGFHTNPDDVKYLTNPEFQSRAMAGVAKGYRLYRAGKACEPFTITSDQSMETVVWGRGKLPIAFGGNPDFPVKVTISREDCSECQAQHESIWNEASVRSFRVEHACRPADLDRSPIRYTAIAMDSNGIKSNAATYTFACKARSKRLAKFRVARLA